MSCLRSVGKNVLLVLSLVSHVALFGKMAGDIPVGKSGTASPFVVVGAGPAGIAVLGMLFDAGVDSRHIVWVDPQFDVGRMGAYYYNVPGNSLAESYITFVNECATFKACSSPALEYLRKNYPYECCTLRVAIDALRDITNDLKTKVMCHTATVQSLKFRDHTWQVTLSNGFSFAASHVVLATGSHPRTLNYPCNTVIPLDDALDKTRLTSYLEPDDTIAVVGGSHSGTLVLKYLHELSVKRVINFYLDPITYAYDMGNGNVPDYNGLKGDVAEWAFSVLEKEHPAAIMRVKNTQAARDAWLPLCNKIIYAVGFERNELPLVDIDSRDLVYDDTTGVFVIPRFFGIGIAFPEKIVDQWGKTQHTVGMIDFLMYAQRIVPFWLQKGQRKFHHRMQRFENVLTIQLIPASSVRSYEVTSGVC